MNPRIILLAALIFALPAMLAARPSSDSTVAAGAAAQENVEEIEEIDLIEEITPTETGSDGQNNVLLTLGRFHPIVVHFPIAWLMLLAFLELAVIVTGRREWLGLGPWLLGLTLLSFIPALSTGLANASQTRVTDPEYLGLMIDHRNLMFVAFGIAAAAFLLRLRFLRDFRGLARWAYLALVLAASAVVGLGAHLGGEMVYGSNYFPF